MASKWKKHLPSDVGSFRRSRESKPPSKSILILTEGMVTEPAYFEGLKAKLELQTLEVEVVPQGKGDPRILAKAAIEERRKRRLKAKDGKISYSQASDFDEMWIVFDSDVPVEHDRYHNGVAFAKANGVNCAQSTPCFEYWLLLHKQFTTAMMPKCEDVIPHLSAVIGKKYDKEAKQAGKLISPLCKDFREAMVRADQVRRMHKKAGTAEPANPSTAVDLLVGILLDNAPSAISDQHLSSSRKGVQTVREGVKSALKSLRCQLEAGKQSTETMRWLIDYDKSGDHKLVISSDDGIWLQVCYYQDSAGDPADAELHVELGRIKPGGIELSFEDGALSKSIFKPEFDRDRRVIWRCDGSSFAPEGLTGFVLGRLAAVAQHDAEVDSGNQS